MGSEDSSVCLVMSADDVCTIEKEVTETECISWTSQSGAQSNGMWMNPTVVRARLPGKEKEAGSMGRKLPGGGSVMLGILIGHTVSWYS